jgi:site-specific DNA-methyltransferase (adenine-specific)
LRDAVALQIARVTRRWVLVFCNVEILHEWRVALEAGGLQWIRALVWVKPNAAPQFTGDRPSAGWESVVLLHRAGRKRWNGGGRSGVFTHPIETGSYGRERVHPTEKPLPLMHELVSLFTDPGELVIDPFAGSGSTGVACQRLGRGFAGAELDAAMAQTARDRLAAEACGSSLAKSRAGQRALFDAPDADDPPMRVP